MAKYRELAGAAKRLGVENAIIDVKLCLMKGPFDYQALGKAITRRQHDLYSSSSICSTSPATKSRAT